LKVSTLAFLTLHTCTWREKSGCSDKLGEHECIWNSVRHCKVLVQVAMQQMCERNVWCLARTKSRLKLHQWKIVLNLRHMRQDHPWTSCTLGNNLCRFFKTILWHTQCKQIKINQSSFILWSINCFWGLHPPTKQAFFLHGFLVTDLLLCVGYHFLCFFK